MKNIIYYISLLLLLNLPQLKAQESVSGRIIDADDKRGLGNVIIRNLKSQSTAISNNEGLFSIRIKSLNDTLLFKLLGFADERIITSSFLRQNKIIEMKPVSQQLQDVIVNTGYQKLTQRNATGAYEQLDSSSLNRRVDANFLQRIDGLTTAIDFDRRSGRSDKFSIRGLSTITANASAPLIVLDDFPYQGDLDDINPEDIASITLLKDAAASAIWGVGAANGVLVISTKKASRKKPLSISYSTAFSMSQKPDLFKQPTMSNEDFLSFERTLFDLGYYNSTLNNTRNRPVVSPYVEMLSKFRMGQITDQELEDARKKFSSQDVRKDFEKYVYQNKINQLHNLSFATGNDKSTTIFTMGYAQGNGDLKGNSTERLNLHSDHTFSPVPFIEINAGAYYTLNRERLDSEGGYGRIISGGGKNNLYPYAALADQKGKPLAIPKDARFGYLDTVGRGVLYDWTYKPLAETELNNHEIKRQTVVLKGGLNLKINKSLQLNGKYQFEKSTGEDSEIYDENSYFARNLVNRYTAVNGGNPVRNIPYGAISDHNDFGYYAHSGRLQFNYDRRFGLRHHLNVIAGGEIRAYTSESRTFRYYGYDPEILTSSAVDYKTSFPIYGTLSSASNIPNIDALSLNRNRNVSIYSNANYTYAGKYTISGSLRRDANNLFGASTNNKWQPLWSLGSNWNLSDEKFYPQGFPSAHIRASYGYTGNVNNSITAYTIITYRQAAIGNNSLTGLPNANITSIPNPDLKWENTRIINTGFDLNGKKVNWNVSIDYYHKKSDDLIGLKPVDPTLGGSSVQSANTAVLVTKGLDLSLSYPVLNKGNYGWRVNILYSNNTNKLKKYLYVPSRFSNYIGSGSVINPSPGQPAYSIASYQWQGLNANGDPSFTYQGAVSTDYRNLISNLGLNDIAYGGSALPTNYGALRNEFRFFDFSFSFNISFKAGYYYRRPSISYSSLAVNWEGNPDYERRWQKPGDEATTNVPAFSYPIDSNRELLYTQSSLLVEPADHIRLKDIRMDYQLKSGNHFKNLTVFAVATDLGLLWKASSYPIDPEYSNSLAPGYTFSLGFKTNIQ